MKDGFSKNEFIDQSVAKITCQLTPWTQTEVDDIFVEILEGKVDIKDGAKNKWEWITYFADVGSCCQKV